jgi:hypothetical protein
VRGRARRRSVRGTARPVRTARRRAARRQVGDVELDAERCAACAQHRERLREHLASTTTRGRCRAARPAHERDGLGDRGRLVEQRRVGDRQPGEVGDHRLEGDQRLEAALADLRLVGRVGRVPGGRLEHVAADDGGRVGAVVAVPELTIIVSPADCVLGQLCDRRGWGVQADGVHGDNDDACPDDAEDEQHGPDCKVFLLKRETKIDPDTTATVASRPDHEREL